MKTTPIFKKALATFSIVMVLMVLIELCICKDFYVSPEGNDLNCGTKHEPFLTITHARDKMREIIKQGLNENISVYISGGVYSITEPIIFGLHDSGSEEFSVIYTAYENEVPIISGGKTITEWEKRIDGIWQTKIPASNPKFRELFVNDKRAQRARHPNEGYFRVAKASEDRMSNFSFNPEDIPENVAAEEIELIFIHDWSIARIPQSK